ncbi:hypothetical protein M409DRAFT_49159 [Zasmidium cellare ATCC 36951]|uniref:Xylanolytic transcriptional activator regulatory domain-containing protein n=1 Tax=Zasmidium cellare ATCC 36951 TaxID=1080233 RepID=A0A6A6CZN3_ZASCE|nr:uncharacterized protein M409DRAFT_49159 [Zasmidium cellare ATCC 36951]KAF2172604.1 hypothetical protein M409DRAFT_49159 [Zasmidium cellare ATCC 36951]
MSRNSADPSRDGQPRPRQEPGSACEECRRRKLRGFSEIGMFDKTLTSFAAAMEERLATVNGATTTDGQAMNASANSNDVTGNPIDMSPPPTVDHPSVSSFCNWIWHDADFSFASNPATPPTFPDFPQTSEDMDNVMALLPQVSGQMDLMEGLPAMDMASNFNNPLVPPADMLNTTPLDQTAALLPDLYHSDRDQAYFERVHNCIPIIHEQSYYAWSNNTLKTEQQVCLQKSMWALATSATAQPLATANVLYTEARQQLEKLENSWNSDHLADVVQAQAWLLLAIYEFVRVDFRRGWMSAGRAFRRIQFMKLHEIDRSDDLRSQSEWVEAEERRRTFWMAYSLDCFISLSNGSPRTFSEQADVRMPAPEISFQSGQPVLMNFLSDAMLPQDRAGPSNNLTDFIIVATICGWAHTHRQQCTTKRAQANPIQAFWERHRAIERLLIPQVAAMQQTQSQMRHADPIYLFTRVMVHAMVLYMYHTMMEFIPNHDGANRALVDAYGPSLFTAVCEVSNISNTLSQMSCFKAHPFCPIALYVCIQGLKAFNDNGGGFSEQLKLASSALDNLRRINIFGDDSRRGSGESTGEPPFTLDPSMV